MSTNSFYRNQLNSFLNLFFAFHDKMIRHELTGVAILDKESNTPTTISNLGELLFQNNIYLLNSGKGNIVGVLQGQINNSLTRSYSIFLDLLGIDANFKSISTNGMGKLVPAEFKDSFLEVPGLINFVDNLKKEIETAVAEGDSLIIPHTHADGNLNLAQFGHAGIEAGSFYSPIAALITYGLDHRLPTEFLIKRMANIQRRNIGRMDNRMGINHVGTVSFEEELILPAILGKTKDEINLEFMDIKSAMGGCPFVHSPTQKSRDLGIEINPDFKDLKMREGLTMHLDEFIQNTLRPLFDVSSEMGKRRYFSQWDRLMLTQTAARLDQEKFDEIHGEGAYDLEMKKGIEEQNSEGKFNENSIQ